ncbi:MAG: glycosyltransferase family 2 protein [Candidatus Omnitrophica bacterium]|nr:glycosyltransferase family 2 protein [Candidatus Omnitrophota bacterium]
MKLIIQIPCLNEAESLPATLAALPKEIPGVDVIETLIIDDGSTDNTSEVARAHGVQHIVRLTTRKGLAVVFATGLDACLKRGADIIVNTDADGQYKGEDIPRLIEPIIAGKADIVIGNRDIENVEQFSFVKKRLQRIGSWVVRQLAQSSIEDTTTGFRAYNREAALRLNIISNYTYTLESIIQAEHKGLAVANITIGTNHVDRPSRLFRSIPEYIKRSMITIVRVYAMFNPFSIFLRLGSFFLIVGGVLGLRFLYYYVTTGGMGKVQSLILTAILLIIGLLFVVIGIIADLISANRRLIEDILLRVKKIEINQKAANKQD